MAAGEIGSWAFEKGSDIVKNSNEELSGSESRKAESYLKVASQLMELASNYRHTG